LREFPDNQRFDVRAPGLFILKICPNVSDMRVGETNDLSRITWVSENFLVTSETGIENDFAAAARDGPRGASVKEVPVFEREGRRSVLDFRQWILPWCRSKLLLISKSPKATRCLRERAQPLGTKKLKRHGLSCTFAVHLVFASVVSSEPK
jgi:hypothetical protein